MPPGTAHELYTVDPNEFVQARNTLAAQLRAAGDNEAAKSVKQLRRPPVPVWALNQAARHDAGAVRAFLDASSAAADAQQAVLDGAGADELRDALARRRDALAQVVSAAREVIDASGRTSETYTRELDDALNAIASSPALRDLFARGELTAVDASAVDAGELLAGFELPDRPEAARQRKSRPKPPSRRLVQARETLERRRADADDAAAALARAEKQLADARRAHERAADALARAEHAVERLEG